MTQEGAIRSSLYAFRRFWGQFLQGKISPATTTPVLFSQKTVPIFSRGEKLTQLARTTEERAFLRRYWHLRDVLADVPPEYSLHILVSNFTMQLSAIELP